MKAGHTLIGIVDISNNGMKIVTTVHLHRGNDVQIFIDGHFFLGKVRHCSSAEDGYYAGIFVYDVMRRTVP